MKLRSIQPTSRRQWIAFPTQTYLQSQTTPYPNQNQSSILSIDLVGMITNPFIVPKGMYHQYIADEAAYVFQASRVTFPTDRKVRIVESTTDSIVSGQIGLRTMNAKHLPEVKLQSQMLLMSQTRTRSKTSSADRQVRVFGRFQLMGIQNRLKEEIQTLENFPRTLIEETLQSQPNTGMGRKIIRYIKTWKLVKEAEFKQKMFFLLFQSEDSEVILQQKLKICPLSDSREEKIAYTEKLEEELRENIIEVIPPVQAQSFYQTFIIPNPYEKWRKILETCSLNKEIQTIHFKMNGTDKVRHLIRKGEWATSLDLKLAFHHLIVYLPY
ncbi:MAG: hypothetical protein EZS28_003916 [Streblomastix strix]|uniref:Reverse transcriptase domain-containing protein n=1 Tax=Streblomastix strix TaxID=222440 RepID=A0A5J4X0H2_9EUKA|nr:MAG: hypothetical protein EZS28_003916 [Streblomastix strix]